MMAIAATAFVATPSSYAQETSIATVVKIAGIQWFNRMEEGVKKYAADTGSNAFQVGPAQADPQQQAALIEDMIAQGVNALAVVPMSPEMDAPLEDGEEEEEEEFDEFDDRVAGPS